MENKEERKGTEPEAGEIADSELDQVSGGFLRRVQSGKPETGGGDEIRYILSAFLFLFGTVQLITSVTKKARTA